MEYTAKTAKITTPSNQTHWGGCFSENGLFIILEVEGTPNHSAPSIGREILDLLLTKFTNYQEKNLTTVCALLEEVKQNQAVTTLTVGILQGDVLYLGSSREGAVLFYRDGKTGTILSSGETSSGKICEGDRVLFTTKTFFSLVQKEKCASILAMGDLDDAAEDGLVTLLKETSPEGAAGLLLQVDKYVSTEEVPTVKLTGLREKGMEIIASYKTKLNSILFPGRQQHVSDPEELRSKKNLLTIAVVLSALLILSIFLNVSHLKSSKKNEKLAQTLELVSHQYDEAVSLLDLNPVRARTLLSDSKLSLSPLLSEFDKNSPEYKQVNDWIAKISEKEVSAYKIYKLTQVPLFFDLSLLKQGGEGKRIAAYKETKVILDEKNQTLYALSTATKQASIIAGGETVKDAKAVAVHGTMAYLVNSDGIFAIDIPSKTSRLSIKKDDRWGEVVSLESFAGNLYLLDRKNSAIWKYIAAETGFTPRQSYLNPDVRADFSRVVKLSIDGSVWVVTPSSVVKFTQGLGENFTFKGFSETFSEIVSVSTSDTDKNIYILDRATNRIVVFDKDGAYQSQYQWDELKKADDIVASEVEKKIFVLSGSKIYAIDIQ